MWSIELWEMHTDLKSSTSLCFKDQKKKQTRSAWNRNEEPFIKIENGTIIIVYLTNQILQRNVVNPLIFRVVYYSIDILLLIVINIFCKLLLLDKQQQY